MHIEEILVEVLQIYNNIDNIGDLYNICKEYGYIGAIDDFVYEIKKVFNNYDIIENSKIDTREELQIAGGRNNLPKKLTAGLLAGLVGIPSGVFAKNEPNSISSTNKKSRENKTTFEKFIYNFINKGDLKAYGLLGVSVVGLSVVLFLINYMRHAKSLEEGLNAFIGLLNQEKYLSDQDLIKACDNLEPLIVKKMKKLGIFITDSNDSNPKALNRLATVRENIKKLQDQESTTLYNKTLDAIDSFIDRTSDTNSQNNEVVVSQETDNIESQNENDICDNRYDEMKNRWVKTVNENELYDDSKPFLAQVILDLKFHKDFADWQVDDESGQCNINLLRNLIVTNNEQEAEEIQDTLNKNRRIPVRKITGNQQLTTQGLEKYVQLLQTNELSVMQRQKDGFVARIRLCKGSECSSLLLYSVLYKNLEKVLEKKYEKAISPARLKIINEYVDQFRDTKDNKPLYDSTQYASYIQRLQKVLSQDEHYNFNEFEKQIILVKLMSDCVEFSLDTGGGDAKKRSIGDGLLNDINRIFREFVLGNESSDKTFSNLIKALEARIQNQEPPKCKRIFRALSDLVSKIDRNDEKFKTLYISHYFHFDEVKKHMETGYDDFRKKFDPKKLKWNFARGHLRDAYSETTKRWQVNEVEKLLQIYYSHQVNLYLGALEEEERDHARSLLNEDFVTSNYALQDLPGYVQEYSDKYANIGDSAVADAFCYQLIMTLKNAFTPITKGNQDEFRYGEKFGIDTIHSLDILETVLTPAMTKFMNEDESPETVYNLIINKLTIEIDKINCPALISKDDKKFADLVKAIREGTENKKHKELIGLLTRAYYRKNAEEISGKLSNDQRKHLFDILSDEQKRLVTRQALASSTEARNIYIQKAKTTIEPKEFVAAYHSANPETKLKINKKLLSGFIQKRPSYQSMLEGVNLAKTVFNWPMYYDKFKKQTLPEDLKFDKVKKRYPTKTETSKMFRIIGYVMYCDNNPLEGYIKSDNNQPKSTTSKYSDIIEALKNWINSNPNDSGGPWDEVINELDVNARSASTSIDYELFGKCYVALQDTNLRDEILDYINMDSKEYVLTGELPKTLQKLYDLLEQSEKNLTLAREELNISDKDIDTIGVIGEALGCSNNMVNDLLTRFGSEDNTPTDIRYLMLCESKVMRGLLETEIRKFIDIPPSCYTAKNIPDDLKTSLYLCANAVKHILGDIVEGRGPESRQKKQKALLQIFDANSALTPDFANMKDDDILDLIKSVNTTEIESIHSKVFSILNTGKADEEVLEFAELDYFDRVNSFYLGVPDEDEGFEPRSGKRYWKQSLYNEDVLDSAEDNAGETNPYYLRDLYATNEHGEKLRLALQVPEIKPKLFQNTVSLVMKNEDPSLLVPTDKFYEFSPPSSPMNDQEIADWYSFPQTSGIHQGLTENSPPGTKVRAKLSEFVAKWCVIPESDDPWRNHMGNSLSNYLSSRLNILTEGQQRMNYEHFIKNPLVVAMAVFEKLAKQFDITSCKDLSCFEKNGNQKHPLAEVLEGMRFAFITTGNVCKAEAEDMCETWRHLIIDTYTKVNSVGSSSSKLPIEPEDQFIGKICYGTRREAVQKMILNDPAGVNPVYGVEAGEQLSVVYSEALNVYPKSVCSEFDDKSGESCGTAEFVTPVAPNRVRAKNASESLTLGSIIAKASELINNAGQTDKAACNKIEDQIKNKELSFEELVSVFDDKSLLLKTNELLSENGKYYFGDPKKFDESWTLRSRLTKLTEKLDEFFEARGFIPTDEAQRVLSNITNYDPKALRDFVTANVMKEFNIDEDVQKRYREYRELTQKIADKNAELTNPTKAIKYVENTRADLAHVSSLPDDTRFQSPDPTLEALIEKYVSNDEQSNLDKTTLITAIQKILTNEELALPKYQKQQNELNQQMKSLEEQKASLETILTDEKRKNIKEANAEIEKNLEDLIISIVQVLFNKIKQQQNMSLQELSFFLKLCVDIYDETTDFDGTVVVSDCKLDKFGDIFTTDILPLYLVDSEYIG
ncbi:MAG: hypothetical protein J6K87_00070 [Clostridia bacterium]|nr:hypothetical protein [Clostridia bacterium]